MCESKLKSEKIYIILAILITVLNFTSMILEMYIFPKIAIYQVSKPNPDLKFTCIQDYKPATAMRYSKSYWVMDNKSYNNSDIMISSATSLTIKYYFPIDYQQRKLVDDIKNKKRECYLVSYIDIINLGFFRKFYLYQYIENDDKIM